MPFHVPWSVSGLFRLSFMSYPKSLATALALLVLGMQHVVQSGGAPFIYTKF